MLEQASDPDHNIFQTTLEGMGVTISDIYPQIDRSMKRSRVDLGKK